MNIVYLGSGSFGIDCLDALAESNNNLQFIVTQPPLPAGRGRKAQATQVAQWAQGNSIEFIETDNVNSPEILEQIASYKPDLIVVAAFGQKIGNELKNLPPKGIINVHASILPKYRGAAPINWAIINGESETGISIISVVEKMDAGAILSQAKTPIHPGETAGELHDRLAALAAPLLVETIDKIADGSVVYTKQDPFKATLARKLKKSDGFLDFSESAELLQRKILGFWPWPGARAVYLSKKTGKTQQVIIAGAEVVKNSNPSGLAKGVIDDELNVICGSDSLRIIKIKPAGSSLMDFKAFANGRKTSAGDMFKKIDT